MVPKARSSSPNRGRGIYFADDEFENLLDEVSAQIVEQRRPVSISEVVRAFVNEGIERNRAKRAGSEGGTRGSRSNR